MCLEVLEGYPEKAPTSATKILNIIINLYKEKRCNYWDEQ